MTRAMRRDPPHHGGVPGEMPKLRKGVGGWHFPGRENNEGHEARRARTGSGRGGGSGAGEGGRTEVAQGTRHLGFPRGTVVTC